MKKIWIFKSSREMIVSIILFVIFIICFIYIGSIDYADNSLLNNQAYVEQNNTNVFKPVNSDSINDILKNDNFILFFSIQNNKWVDRYRNMLLDVSENAVVDTIYYYDITSDLKDKNANYQNCVNYFSDYANKIGNDDLVIYAPAIVIKKDGEVIYFNDDTAIVKGNIDDELYWDEEKIENFKNEILQAFLEYNGD